MVALDSFFGLEIDDFACQAARLGLWIAQYQMDELLRKELGRTRPFLPLRQAGRITQGNAARIDWLLVCPAAEASETIVVGNPPFKGSKYQSQAQREDMRTVFSGRVPNSGELDYVAIWFLKGADYAKSVNALFAFVSTNSLVQGSSVATLWPHLLDGLEIRFAHRSFKWSNLATKNAGVTCIIVGLGMPTQVSKSLYDGDTVRQVELIGPYLAPNVATIVSKRSRPIALDFDSMVFGNMPLDGRKEKLLRMSGQERAALIAAYPAATHFIRPIFGTEELINRGDLWCIWVNEGRLKEVMTIKGFRERFESLRQVRLRGGADMRKIADKPWSFREGNESKSHTIMVPAITSEHRQWLPVDVHGAESIPSSRVYAIFDGEVWQASVLSSRHHLLWMQTVSGTFETRPLYSNQIVWNTFPLPNVSEHRKAELEEHWWEIDRARKEAGFGRTLGELYAPKTMPPELRRAHEELDETVERIFGGRRYRSDADRIEHLLQLYDTAIEGRAAR